MSYEIQPTQARPLTAGDANTPHRVEYYLGEGKTVSGAIVNDVLMPTDLTLQVMGQTEAGVNVVDCASMDDLFEKLES